MRVNAKFVGAYLLVVACAVGAVRAQVAALPGQARDGQVAPVTHATGTGVLAGRITMAGTGQPVGDVRVTLSGAELRGSRSALTNDDGYYAFTELPAGTFTVRGTLTGYVAGTFGQKAPGKPGTAIVLRDGQQYKEASFEIARGGVITGIVLDEKNRPSIGTPVRVMRWMMQAGERMLVNTGSGTTDDRGMYRVYNLMPGEYVVSAVPRNATGPVVVSADMVQTEARLMELSARGLASGIGPPIAPTTSQDVSTGYAPVFYPGTTALEAARAIRVGISEEHAGIDFSLTRVALTTVTGHVAVPPGVNPTTVQVRLIQPDGFALGMGPAAARASSNGAFTLRSVVPGQYLVYASASVTAPRPAVAQVPQPPVSPAQQRRLWATADLYVDGSLAPVVSLTLQEGFAVSGQLVFNGSAPVPTNNERVRVTMNPLGQPVQSLGLGSWSTAADASGQFTVPGVVPGRYRISATGAPGWQVTSVLVNGLDVLDFPFVVDPGETVPSVTIQFGDRTTDLRGTLTDANAAATADYSVVIFPEDQRYWIPYARRMRSVRPNTDGAFVMTGLPPGDYRLAAVTDLDANEWLDPEFLRQLLPASIGVRLLEGQSTIQDIRVR